ncbi:MAG: hypothetical protein JO061_15720 [Acidobacteriaceae bacterium]|nr:hypothetical protein [Acidobacteriaceae bacterium]
MKALSQFYIWTALRSSILAAAAISFTFAQTQINLGSQAKNVDFTNSSYTRPVKTGTSLPSTCSPGDLFFKTNAPAGQNLYGCPVANTWATQGVSASGLADPGSNGLVIRTAPNTTSVVAAPTGTVVGTTDTQTLLNKSIDASEINTGTLSTARMPALSGDVSTSAGSTTATLATVNSSPGSYGDASHTVQLTVDSKGRVTGISQLGINTMSSGTLSAMPTTCTTGTLYFASDQPAGQQVYTCSGTNTWTQLGLLGPSGALLNSNGAIDINTSVLPRLQAANNFTGSNTFGGTTTVANATCTGTCTGFASSSSSALKLVDANNNNSLTVNTTASAVNYASVTNAATGQNVAIGSAGSDTNIGLLLQAKGSGLLQLGSNNAYVDNAGNLTVTSCTGCSSSGTAAGNFGDIQFNSGGALAATDNFFWDNSNFRLGIGTKSPVDAITISKSGASTGISLQAPTSTAGITSYITFGTDNSDGAVLEQFNHEGVTYGNFADCIALYAQSGATGSVNGFPFSECLGSVGIGAVATSPSGLVNTLVAYNNGHIQSQQAAAPTVSGGTLDAAATDHDGTVTLSATSATITFHTAYSAAPHCVVTDRSSGSVTSYTPSTTTLAITDSSSSHVLDYICWGK